MKWKHKVVAVITILGIAGGIFVYYWADSTQSLRSEAQNVLHQVESFEELQTEVDKEYDRCQAFISQSEGDFGSFEYCKRFIEWVNATPGF